VRKTIITALIAAIVGFVLGAGFWYLASPLWVDRQVAEGLPPELVTREIAKGTFRDTDAVHQGSGKVTLFETAGGLLILRFTDFSVTNGPDLKVYLVKAADIRSSADVTASEWTSLGPLKGNIGDQNYVLPETAAAGAYRSVVVWCEQFSVLFSAADLQRSG